MSDEAVEETGTPMLSAACQLTTVGLLAAAQVRRKFVPATLVESIAIGAWAAVLAGENDFAGVPTDEWKVPITLAATCIA